MNPRAFLSFVTALLTALLLSACGGGGGGGASSDTLAPPIGEISGDWSVTETITSTDCPGAANDYYTLAVSQSGNTVSVYDGANTFQGVLDGNILRWSGSYYESGGYNTINSMALTVASDCNSLSGNVGWSWSDGSFSCSGTTAVSAYRLNPVGCGTSTTTPTGLSGLAGTWYGSIEDGALNMHTLSVTIDSSGTITDTSIDGSSSGVSATITADPSYSQLYGFQYTDGTFGGFFADSTQQHAAFIDSAGNVGVVQKGASTLPSYTESFLIGSWSGNSLTVDGSLNTTSMVNGSATVTSTGALTGSDAFGSFSGQIKTINYSYGRFGGDYTYTGGSGIIRYFVSADGQFAASYAGTSGWPTGFAFSMLTKQ